MVLPGRALAADVVTLHAKPSPVSYGSKVALSGTLAPAAANETVVIYARKSHGLSRVANTTTDGLGAFSVSLPVSHRAVYVARALDETGAVVESAPVSIHVLPRIVVSLRGSKNFGARLFLAGRMLPHTAGVLTLDSGDRVNRVSVDAAGRFAAPLTTTGSFRYRATLRLHPASGYVGWHASRLVDVQLPGLAFGSHGPAVFWLQESLRRDGYALPSLSSLYDSATVDAVLAFEKVQGLPLTGSVNRRFWNRLGVAGPPRARIPYGDHIEVSKTTQLLYEVRAGKVVSVTRVSTGATGNTPVGHFYVYSKGPGFNAKGMYDSLFFLRGFAIHGYASVPTYPASHGCVRTPLWFAPGFYSRWNVGASVYVFA
jgi:L,D-transpeptidase catalytic domain/Putative peptidoglycan binding domain